MNIRLNPAALRTIEDFVADEITAEEVTTLTAPDPFGIDDPCPYNRAGHVPQPLHRQIVCVCCSKIFWG